MQRIRLTLAYMGAAFAGWQTQERPGAAPLRTVQFVLEKALFKIIGHHTRIHGSGRTDSGVHAEMQVAHFDAPEKLAHINWIAALQRHLPDDISILSAEQAPSTFHARFKATGKIYVYSLWLQPRIVPARIKPFVWPVPRPDFGRMDEAAALLMGTHDFAPFQNSGGDIKDTTRTLHHIRRYPLPLPLEQAAGFAPVPDPDAFHAHHPYWAWEFYGDGFLKQMARNLMGFIVAAGLGKLEPREATSLFEHKNRSALSFATAPAKGLTLKQVLY